MESKELDGKVNPYSPQDRVGDTFDMFNKHGYAIYPQQRQIYKNLADWFYRNRNEIQGPVVEVGCGSGVGSVMIHNALKETLITFYATDVDPRHIRFGQELYQDMRFEVWDIRTHFKQPRASYIMAVEVFEHLSEPQKVMDNLLMACKEGVWLSTPNGVGKPRPPENPHHVREYQPFEISDFAENAGAKKITMYHWKTFQELDSGAGVDPLVYFIEK